MNHWRNRETGPRISLAVVQCRTHQVSFTLYPPGHVPYGRKAIVGDVSIDGFQVGSEEPEEISDTFEGTLFDGALKGDQGVFLSKKKTCEPPGGCYDTQLNDIKKSATILGIFQDAQTHCHIHIAEILHLPQTPKTKHFSGFSDAEWNAKRTAQTICKILKQIPSDNRFERLISCGSLGGLWPPLHIWNPNTKKLYESTYSQRIKFFKNDSANRAPPS